MSELQKEIIEKLLKEKKKRKRDLAKYLNIKENSINRTLKNPNISISRLKKIAEFVGKEVRDLIPEETSSSSTQEPTGEYRLQVNEMNEQATISNLSEILKINSRTIEIMAETEKENSKSIANLVNMMSNKNSDSNK